MSEFVGEIAEVQSLLQSATFPAVRALLQTHLSKLQRAETAQLQREAQAQKEAQMDVDTPEPASSAPTAPRSAPVTVGAYVPIDDFAWDQVCYSIHSIDIIDSIDS
mmetsp:Transcript_17717/g.39286  ORF Transcript_17717/g.39286 Transcript_17717/m.39286 type:complete len:106 (+) Transcript_17717:135-452(+)